MTPMEYQQRVLQTVVQLNTRQDYLGLCALGLAGELAEVIELFENYAHLRDTLDPERMQSEIGDVLWYVVVLCSVLEFPFDQMIVYASRVQLTDITELESYAFSSMMRVGTVCDLIKKHLYHRNAKPLDVQKLYTSLYSLCYALGVFSLFVGLTLEQVMIANIAKLEARHSQGFTSRYVSDSHASE